MLLGVGGGPALIELSLFPLSPIPNCLSFPYIYLSLSLPLSASDDVSQSGFENLGKLLFCICTVLSIMKLQVIVLVLLPVLAMTIHHL